MKKCENGNNVGLQQWTCKTEVGGRVHAIYTSKVERESEVQQ